VPLTVCPDCRELISDSVSVCPKCGRAISSADIAAARARGVANLASAKRKLLGCFAVAFLAVAGLIFVVERGGPSKPNDLDGPKTTLAGYPVCTSLESLRRTVELADDPRALAAFMGNRYNGCTLLKPAVSVVVEDYEAGGYVKIRPIGSPNSVWVMKRAIGIQ
jgi:hypothetical protein